MHMHIYVHICTYKLRTFFKLPLLAITALVYVHACTLSPTHTHRSHTAHTKALADELSTFFKLLLLAIKGTPLLSLLTDWLEAPAQLDLLDQGSAGPLQVCVWVCVCASERERERERWKRKKI